jgi:hypothetical protein
MLRRLSAKIGNAAGKLRGRAGGGARPTGTIRRAASAGAGRASGT